MQTRFTETAYTNGYEFTSGAGYALPEYPFVEPPEIRNGAVKRHPSVIVGGGITGLTLACSLARLGVAAVLFDEDNTVGVKGASSRARTHASARGPTPPMTRSSRRACSEHRHA